MEHPFAFWEPKSSEPSKLNRATRWLDFEQLERPLGVMQSEWERLHQICRIIDGVSACLVDLADCPTSCDFFDVMELVGRLDFAADSMRRMGGTVR